jgi:type I restriction enzyme S subunit
VTPYPAYKDSGIEWLGEIPSHWEIKRFRFACTLDPSKSEISNLLPDSQVSFLPMEKIGEDGSVTLDETRSIEQVWQGYTYFRDKDVVVAKITPCFENGKGAMLEGLINGVGFGTTELHVLRASEITDPKFIFYLTRSHPFRRQGVAMMYGAAGQQRVPGEFFKNFTTGFPSLPEQRAIAAYLDRETARLDDAITEARRLIGLLHERRAALIAEAVTGKATKVQRTFRSALHLMKDSGIEWLGEIPSHWGTAPVWTLFELGRGRVISNEEIQENLGPYPVFSSQTSDQGAFGYINTFDFEGIYLTWTTDGANAGTVFYREGKFNCTNVCGTLRAKTVEIEPKFFGYALNIATSFFVRHDINPKLMNNVMARIRVPFPSLAEQRAIAAYLDRETAHIDATVAEAETLIAHLEEYRAALIAAAVTGKMQVQRT